MTNLLIISLSIIATICYNNIAVEGATQYSYTAVQNYKAPAEWGLLSGTACGHSARQSPIDIVTKDTEYDDRMEAVKFTGTELNGSGQSAAKLTVSVSNSGKTLNMVVNQTAVNVRTHFGTRGEDYRVHSMHWHWGNANEGGSEHTVNGKIYPMELHIISWRDSVFTNFADAYKGFEGLVVLGILYETVPDSQKPTGAGSDFFDRLGMAMGNLTRSTSPAEMVDLDISTLLPSNTEKYFRYPGSLTTPDCNDNVNWNVFNTTYKISNTQFKNFYDKMYFNYGTNLKMQVNHRPPLPLNPSNDPSGFKRIVTSSFKASIDGATPSQMVSTALLTMVLITFKFLFIGVF